MGRKLKTEIVRSSSKFDTLKRRDRMYNEYYEFEEVLGRIHLIAVTYTWYFAEPDPAIYTTYTWRAWQFWAAKPQVPEDVWQEATARFDTYE